MLIAQAELADRIDTPGTVRALVSRFFHVGFRQARDCGVRLRLRTDFERLSEINLANRGSWAPLLPTFDAAHNDLSAGGAVWIEGLNSKGETISTCAARAFCWPETTLADEARSLRLFYRDPTPHLAAGDSVVLPDTPAPKITGYSACIGALWVDPGHRGVGLTKITSRLCKAYAYMHWQAAICWSFANPAHFASGGVARAFGAVNVDEGVRLLVGNRDRLAVITYQPREAFLPDIARAVCRGEIESSRRMDTTLTNESLPERCQGIASR
jgi:hypothetical protein